MQGVAGQWQLIDVRRVVDRVVCDWTLAGHCQTLHIVLPAGSLRSTGDSARLRRVLIRLMKRAARTAGRFDQMLLLVERIDDRIVLRVGIRSKPLRAIRLPLVVVNSIMRSSGTVGRSPAQAAGLTFHTER